MKRRAKLEDIVWIAERGERYVIPERRHDWLMLCLKNASSKNAVQEIDVQPLPIDTDLSDVQPLKAIAAILSFITSLSRSREKR